MALWSQSRWEEALRAFDEGERLAEEAGDPLLAAQIPIAAILALSRSGRSDAALELAAGLEERLRSLGAEEDAAKVLANAGIVHSEREAFADALRCYEAALAYFERAGQSVPVARLRMNVANVLTHLNRLAEALRMFALAREAMEAAGMRIWMAGLDGNVGFLQYMAGRYTESLRAYSRAREGFEALGLAKDVAQCDRETADLYLDLNLAPEALETYQRVLPVFEDRAMAGEQARAELGMAIALGAQGREAAALEALARAERAFRTDRNEIGVARVLLQRAVWQRRQPLVTPPPPHPVTPSPRHPATSSRRHPATPSPLQEPATSLRQARRLFRRHGLRMGEVLARLQLAEMAVDEGGAPVAALRRLAREIEAGAFISLTWRVEAALARACRTAALPRAAVRHLRRAVDAVERGRAFLRGDDLRIAFLRDKMRIYEELLEMLLEGGSRRALLEAFHLAERAKSRALLELLAGPVEESAARSPGIRKLLGRLDELRAELNWSYGRVQQLEPGPSRLAPADPSLPRRVRSLEREYVQVQRQLHLDPASESATLPHLQASVRALQAALAPDEQLVEYVAAGDEILAFVLDRTRLRLVRGLCAMAELEERIHQLRFQWSRHSQGEVPERLAPRLLATTRRILGSLYELLLEPLESLLPGAKLTVVPHGLLHAVPFHALASSTCGEAYALDRWEVACAPSGAVWRACRLAGDSPARGSLVLGISGPELNHVREEVAALGALLPGARVFEDDAATLATVPREGAFRFLHFATHGVFRPDNPLFSGLRLADGWLIAHDLYRRRLQCSLATLSACRTGMSQVGPGDEVLGLTRAFLHAGARAVLVSLWTAHDAATAALMRECYSGLSRGMGRAAALRSAQQTLREQYPDPYHWAAFTLIGDR